MKTGKRLRVARAASCRPAETEIVLGRTQRLQPMATKRQFGKTAICFQLAPSATLRCRCCSPTPVEKVRPVCLLGLETTSLPFCCCFNARIVTISKKVKETTDHDDQSWWNVTNLQPELMPNHSLAMPRLALFSWLESLTFSCHRIEVRCSYRHVL